MKQRIFSLFTALCLCLTLLPTAAFAEGDESSSELHTHCVCGANHTVIGDHTEEKKIPFIAWTSNNSLPTASGYFYLTEDVTLSTSLSAWEAPDKMVLCLNGHTITCNTDNSVITVNSNITFTLTDCQSGEAQGKLTHGTHDRMTNSGTETIKYFGRGVDVSGTFKMYGGDITGNSGYEGGGVYSTGVFNLYGGSITNNISKAGMKKVSNGGGVDVYSGTFKMYSGTISGNTTTDNPDAENFDIGVGGGVCVEMFGAFEMHGGTITGNSASEGGGVYIDSSQWSKITLSGNAKITGNKMKDDSTTSNVYLSDGMTITLTEDGFNGTAGITTATAPTVPAPVQVLSGLEDYSGVKDKFTSDVNNEYYVNDSGQLAVDRCKTCSYENGVCTVCGYVCPHSNITGGKCGDCESAMIAKVEHTEGGDTTTGYYSSFNAAIEAVKAGDTVKLLTNVTGDFTCASKSITLDLNGKNLSSLTVSGTAIKVKDSVGSGEITLTTSDGVKVIDLLESGYAFKSGNETWYDSTHNETATSVTNAEVKPVPITGVSIMANKNSCDYGYTAENAPTFTATAEGTTVTYKWYVNGDEQTGNTGSTFTFPTGKSVNTYTVKCEVNVDGYAVTSDEITVTVTKATPTYTAPTANTLTYNGGQQALVQAGSTNGGTMQYKLGENGTWSDRIPEAENAGDYEVYWQIVGGTNYENIASAENQNIVEVTIGKKDVTITPDADQSKKFGATDPTLTYTTDLTGDIVAKFNDQHNGSLSRVAGENVGEYAITIGTLSGGTNFNVKFSNTPVYFNITKADAPTGVAVADIETVYTVAYGTADLRQLISGMPADAGTISYAVDTENLPSQCTASISEDGKTFSFTVPGPGTVGGGYAFPVIVSSTNYQDVTLNVNLTFVDKEKKTLDVTMTGWTYGETANTPQYTKPEDEGTETRYYKIKGADDSTYTTTVPENAGDYTVKVSYETATEIYTGTADFTIAKATPTGAPKYTAITTSGKTLTDAALTTEGGTFSVDGTVKWVDTNGNELASTTEVKANTAYKWLFTPTDSTNYNTISGEITLWHKSSGGGSSSNTTGTTVKNPDGSTTTTTTDKKTGEVTETTKNPNGVTGSTVTDKNGNVTDISAKVPDSAVKDGETVTIPVDEVKPADKSENAPEIKVDVPTGGATIEIPVDDPTPGTVIVIVDKNGNETIVPDSKVTENGIEIKLTEDATIKVIENSKDFSDVKSSDYFDKAVDWASSRGITGGNSATTFGPHDSCSRAQLVTFLWRAAGQPEAANESSFADVHADAYYAKAVAWAAENGIVGGYGNGLFGSDDTITREQFVTILYRFAQKTGMDTTQGGMAVREYKDYDSISDYAVTAIQWAVNAGVMQGYDGNLMPGQPCTRAQIVTMLYRLLGA